MKHEKLTLSIFDKVISTGFMFKTAQILLFISFFTFKDVNAQYVYERVVPHLHSHNDYLKEVPLWGALENGAHSIEIDVFSFEGELKIAHIGFALKQRDNFTDFYLKPLVEYLKTDSFIYEDTPLTLMLDFKNNSDTSLQLLLEAIEPFKEYFSYYHKDSVYEKSLKLLISGSGFSYDAVKEMDSIYVFLDGSVHYCDITFPHKLVPRGSANYKSNFKWKGKGDMPQDEVEKLRELVREANKCNKKLRFYAMPHNERIWRKFLDEGVYWINTDNSLRFARFYFNNAYF